MRLPWTSAVLVLIVSIGLFIGAGVGGWKWSWDLVLMIVGVLLVHEAGHYVAMKAFNYRNVRMFFIPFLGAAVSGQHFHAPEWKKITVALMGPLPGIFLAGVFGIVGIIKDSDALVYVATFAIILNGFQLLPVLPLDGGRVMHSVLFCRHHALDTIFRIVAAASLAGLGALTGDKILLFLGLFLAVTIPTAFKIGKIATELRREGWGPGGPAHASAMSAISSGGNPPASGSPAVQAAAPPTTPFTIPATAPAQAEEHAIPQPVAEVITDRVKAQFPGLTGARQLATMTLQVYETLATRPPSAAASIGFASLHGGSFFMALVLLMVLAVLQYGLHHSEWPFGPDPTLALEPEQITRWDGPESASALGAGTDAAASAASSRREHDTIVATFTSVHRARAAFDDLKTRAPAHASTVLFGQTVLLSLRSEDEAAKTAWFTELEAGADDAFVDDGGQFRAFLTVTCVAPDEREAQAIVEELDNYLELPSALWLIPPWTGDDVGRRTSSDRADHELARATYRKLRQVAVFDAPELEANHERMKRAARHGDQAEYDRVVEERTRVIRELQMREFERIRDGAEGPVHQELVDRYMTLRAVELNEEASDDPAGSGAATAPAAAQEEPEVERTDDDAWDEDAFLEQVFGEQRSKLGPLLGQLPRAPQGGPPPSHIMRYSSLTGFTGVPSGSRILVYTDFHDPSHGAPALVRWLQQKGCTGFQYAIDGTGIWD